MTNNRRSWWGEDAGQCFVLVGGAGILLAGFDTRPDVSDVVVGVAFAGLLSGNRLFGIESSHWGPFCLFLCLVPFAENYFCFADDTPLLLVLLPLLRLLRLRLPLL